VAWHASSERTAHLVFLFGMEPSLTGLRVLRAVAERGSFTAAGAALDYTQSAVSRQVAALEREAGVLLVERRTGGVRLTAAGATLLRHAVVALDEIDTAARELAGAGTVREVHIGVYISAGAALLPGVLDAVRRAHPGIRVTSQEGTTPALVRALRAGTLDLAVITSRPPHGSPDDELPRLVVATLGEADLLVAVPAAGRFAGRTTVTVDELADCDWIASPSTRGEPVLGVWPGLAGRPRVAHHARDWLSKLLLVQSGWGVTTLPANLVHAVPPGVLVLEVQDGPPQHRRVSVIRAPGPPAPDVAAVLATLHRPAAP